MGTIIIRKFLNRKGSASSGSVFAYSGKAPWNKGGKSIFFEVADCHGKVRLHKSDADSKKDFIQKIRKLAKVALIFADKLEATK